MKTFTLALAFLAAVAVDVAYAKSCKSSDDCGEKQCCAGFMPFRGFCRNLTKENKKCMVGEPIFPFNEIHIVACPCEEGLECEKVEKKGKKNKDGVCKKPATEEPETTTADGSSETTGDDGSSETTGVDGSSETTGADRSSETTVNQSGESTGTPEQSGETTQDGSTSGETTQDDATSGEVQTEAPEE